MLFAFLICLWTNKLQHNETLFHLYPSSYRLKYTYSNFCIANEYFLNKALMPLLIDSLPLLNLYKIVLIVTLFTSNDNI